MRMCKNTVKEFFILCQLDLLFRSYRAKEEHFNGKDVAEILPP